MAEEEQTTTAAEQEPGAPAADKEETTVRDFTEKTPKERQKEILQQLAINPHGLPELNPESPEFNPELYRQQLEDLQRRAANTQAIMNGLIQATGETIRAVSNAFNVFRNSETAKRLSNALQYLADNRENIERWIEETEALQPYIDAELKKRGITEDEIEAGLPSEPDENGLDAIEQIIEAARLAKAAVEALPQLESSGTPKYYTSPNTTLANALQANDGKGEVIGAGPMEIAVLGKDTAKEVTIWVDATLENMEGVTLIGKPYTEYDRAVHDSIVSIYMDREKQGLPTMATAEMIYRTMTHKTEQEKVSPQQKAAVTRSVDKMSQNIRVKIDASEEMQRRGATTADGKPVTKFVKSGFLLSADKIEAKAGGKTVTGYVMHRKPLLLEYAQLNGQLITVNGKMLDIQTVDPKTKQLTGVSIPNTDSRISIKSYLLRRVEVMRHDEKAAADALRKYNNRRKKDSSLPEKTISDFRKQTHTIKLDTVFDCAGVTDKNTRSRSRDYVFQVLDYWKATGDIKGYSKRKGTGRGAGKTIDAVIIDL